MYLDGYDVDVSSQVLCSATELFSSERVIFLKDNLESKNFKLKLRRVEVSISIQSK